MRRSRREKCIGIQHSSEKFSVKECLVDIRDGIAATVNDTIEEKFTSFKGQFIDDNASFMESALMKARRDPHQLKSRTSYFEG